MGRILSVREERTQKLVDTGENESRQKCEIFDAFSNGSALVSIIALRNRGIFFFPKQFWKQREKLHTVAFLVSGGTLAVDAEHEKVSFPTLLTFRFLICRRF